MSVSRFFCARITGWDASFCHRAYETGKGYDFLRRIVGRKHILDSWVYHEMRKWIDEYDRDEHIRTYGLAEPPFPERRP